MKLKSLIYIGLILGVGLCGCNPASQHQHGEHSLENLRAPSADQIREWAGLSERTHLTMVTNVPKDVWYGDEDVKLGKFTWLRAYEERKGSNIRCFVIAVYEPGAFCPTNRLKLIKGIEHLAKEISEKDKKRTPMSEEAKVFGREIGSMTMPNGQKSYGCYIGVWPTRFALGPKFDVIAYEYFAPISYEGHAPADWPEMCTKPFYQFFNNVHAFLTSH